MERKNNYSAFVGILAISLAGVSQCLSLDNTQMANAQTTRLRADLNGLQLRNPGNGAIYWVDEGRIRHIQNPEVYKSLFVPKFLNAIDTVSITSGSPVTSNNRLVRCSESNHPLRHAVFLLDSGVKRHVTSPAVMAKNNFNWEKVRNTDCAALASIPSGVPIR